MKIISLPRYALTVICALGIVSAITAKTKDLQPFRVTMEPQFPFSLANEGFTEGHAEFFVVVDNQGMLRDHLLISTSHPLFAEAVDSVLPVWDFFPVTIEGQRVNAKHRIIVNFYNTGTFVVGWDSPQRIIDSRLSAEVGNSAEKTAYHIASLDELDALPQPVQVAQPRLPEPDLVPAEGLRLVYHFFIDQTGKVRIPWLDEQQFQHVDDTILDATYDALMQWEFTPPTNNGEPVTVRASQPFLFVADDASLVDTN